ncbi:Hypothetical Protein FCC1311_004472 [Hondaea fermentalgiana]|uniref:Uncharacterized protein n=1 Tax=Hondaea fermentalgiana TaxID=2315210 RepID=A0A2R5G1P5_9STRA|nr:Hypothetical Protein FCC1311_004472 [Hondaea fermentalgiana]|eukprot:GBG24229.1 Hypothetical Protein FCC1311_004472 [Hondaea fermentalgiana]
MEDLKESLEYSERLYERTAPSLEQMLRVGRAKRDQNAWLLAAVCRERGHTFARSPKSSALSPPSATPQQRTQFPSQTPRVTTGLRSTRKAAFVQSELKPRNAENSMQSANVNRGLDSRGLAGVSGTPKGAACADEPLHTPQPTPMRRRGSLLSVASDCDSDPRTPTLEDFGLANRYADFNQDEDKVAKALPLDSPMVERNGHNPPPQSLSPSGSGEDVFGKAPKRGVSAEGPADCFLLEEDLDALPSYVQTQVDVPTLNKVLDLVSNQGSISLSEIEKVAASSGASGSGKALVLALLDLGRLESGTRRDTYQLAE